MDKRRLGSNGFEVSEVGLGCWQLGADWGKSFSTEEGLAILREAVAQGITFFDTADVYGSGKSERIIGEFLRHCDAPVRVATKFGRGDEVFPNHYSESALRRAVEASLERLGVESLDLLQLHCIPTDVMRQGDIFDWLRALKNEGLIKSFGASVETVEEGLLCLEQEEITSLQVIFNIFRQKLVGELLPKAHQKGVGIIVRLPLASGLLTGKFTAQTRFEENDHRNYNRDGACFNVGETFAGLPFQKGVELADAIRNELLPESMTMVELALRWILDHEAVSTIIPGASSPRQVASNAAVAALPPLSDELHAKLAEFYQGRVHDHIRGAY
ncbi:MAG: aldo/keto reductase [Pontiellaceae bacterium]|nr:aldo/keto reductase [Pontiellaceae bacterium]